VEITVPILACPESLVADVDDSKTKDTIHYHDAPIKKTVYPNELILVIDPSRFADRMYRHYHSHGEFGMYGYRHPPALLVLGQDAYGSADSFNSGRSDLQIPVVGPSCKADKMYRHWHSHAYLVDGVAKLNHGSMIADPQDDTIVAKYMAEDAACLLSPLSNQCWLLIRAALRIVSTGTTIRMRKS
jgi:hypothetical protein